jgi:16S rRNA processing protein RimM
MSNDALILVGAIVGAFGVKGELRVKSFTAEPSDIFKYAPFLDEKGAILFEIKSWREIKDGFAFYPKNQLIREDAMQLRGTKLFAPRAKLPPIDDDEFYHIDLIGLRVESLTGDYMGKISRIMTGAQDILEIENHPDLNKAWLLPFTLLNVPIVDISSGKIIVDVPDGLLELDTPKNEA